MACFPVRWRIFHFKLRESRTKITSRGARQEGQRIGAKNVADMTYVRREGAATSTWAPKRRLENWRERHGNAPEFRWRGVPVAQGLDIVLDCHGQDRLLGAGFLALITPTFCQ